MPSNDPANDGANLKDNFMDYEIEGTFTTYTYISKKLSNPVTQFGDGGEAKEQYEMVKAMDKRSCSRSFYSEEGVRAREQGWFEFPILSYAQLSFDFRNIPPEMVYNEHYKIAIYASPSRCSDE